MSWKTISCSCSGVSHINRTVPCQDYVNYVCVDDFVLGAVADGAGSAKYAEAGARCAVDQALSFATNELDNSHSLEFHSFRDVRLFFEKLVISVREKLEKEAKSQGVGLYDLSSTLLMFIASPTSISAVQVGDGFIVTDMSRGEYELLFIPHKGEFINETVFLTSGDILEKIQVHHERGTPKFICAATDGLERVALNIRNWKAHQPFFHHFAKRLSDTLDAEVELKDYLRDFLNSDRINQETDDDKTLLFCSLDFMASQKVKSVPYPLLRTDRKTLSTEKTEGLPNSLTVGFDKNSIQSHSTTYGSCQSVDDRAEALTNALSKDAHEADILYGNTGRGAKVEFEGLLFPSIVCHILAGWIFYDRPVIIALFTLSFCVIFLSVAHFRNKLSADERKLTVLLLLLSIFFSLSSLELLDVNLTTFALSTRDLDLLSTLKIVPGLIVCSILLAIVATNTTLRVVKPSNKNRILRVVLSSYIGFSIGLIVHFLSLYVE